jgi:hypothetical protein
MAEDKTLVDGEGKPKYTDQSPEIAGKSGKNNQPGIYRHPETGAEVITAPGNAGVPMADALVRLKFVRVADVPSPDEIRKMQADQRATTLAEEAAEKAATQPSVAPSAGTAELLARIAAAEARADAAEGRAVKAEDAATTAAEAAEKAAKALEAFTAAQPVSTDETPAAPQDGAKPKTSNK